jgi:hypothetical protein
VAVRVQPRQLAFALPHAESLTRDNFLEGPANEAALSLVESWPDWPNRIMLLLGPEGSGKSHLAAIWAEQAGARSISAHALTPAAVPGALATGALVVAVRLSRSRSNCATSGRGCAPHPSCRYCRPTTCCFAA